MEPLNNSQLRQLKGKAQLLEPVLNIGKEGLSNGFLKSMEVALDSHELLKVKFVAFKEEKKQLAPLLAEKTNSHLIMRVGNVAVFYRAQSDPAKRRIKFD